MTSNVVRALRARRHYAVAAMISSSSSSDGSTETAPAGVTTTGVEARPRSWRRWRAAVSTSSRTYRYARSAASNRALARIDSVDDRHCLVAEFVTRHCCSSPHARSSREPYRVPARRSAAEPTRPSRSSTRPMGTPSAADRPCPFRRSLRLSRRGRARTPRARPMSGHRLYTTHQSWVPRDRWVRRRRLSLRAAPGALPALATVGVMSAA